MSSISLVYFGLLMSAFLACYSLRFYRKDSVISFLFCLTLSALILRLCISTSDPYLYDWDEKFHALVAKNLINAPLKPMLFTNPVLPYESQDWCCNHIWTHKPPLFLWLIALSIKTFGLKVISVRIPSILLGSMIVPIIYDISRLWLNNSRVSCIAALLFSFSFYQIELITGRIALDHNDVIFQFFVIASIWGFIRFVHTRSHPIMWSLLIGMLSGAAILTKWLVGLLVYLAWFVYTLLSREFQSIRYFVLAILMTTLIALPWQLYILHTYPVESRQSYKLFFRHITDTLGTIEGDNFYHLAQLNNIYDYAFFPFILLGVYFVARKRSPLTIPILSMIGVVYLFFSLIMKTKMPSFTIIVSPLIWILIASGLNAVFSKLTRSAKYSKLVLCSSIMLFTIIALKPWDIIHHRTSLKVQSMIRVHNSNIYRNLDIKDNAKNIIINCSAFDNIDIMFYTGVTAYPWYPDITVIDSLSEMGYQFHAFDSHNEYVLPQNIKNHPNVLLIDAKLK